MAEEVSAALGRFRAPRLIATATFWDGVGPASDAMSRCRTYNLDYIIDGTIQVIDSRVRVTVTLLDGTAIRQDLGCRRTSKCSHRDTSNLPSRAGEILPRP